MLPYHTLEPYLVKLRLLRSGLKLNLFVNGPTDSLPVILIHGLADEADTWRHLISPLATYNRVIAPDLPGFGRSEKPKRSYTISFFLNVLTDLLDTLAVERAILIGHSLGALIAQSFALQSPQRVNRLVLIGGSLVARSQKINLATFLFLVPGLGEYFYNRLRKNPRSAYRSLEPYYYNLESLPEADKEFLFKRVTERVWDDGQRRAFLSTIRNLARWLPGQQRDLPTRLAGLDIPTLVIWGEDDQMNPVANANALVSVQPTAKLVVIPRSGHNLHQENAQAVLEAIRAII